MHSFILLILMAALIFWGQHSQRKQQQARLDKLNQMKKGDEVVTIGGLYGIIDEVREADQTVVLDCDGIYLTFERAAIKTIVAKTQAVSGASEASVSLETGDLPAVEAVETTDGDSAILD